MAWAIRSVASISSPKTSTSWRFGGSKASKGRGKRRRPRARRRGVLRRGNERVVRPAASNGRLCFLSACPSLASGFADLCFAHLDPDLLCLHSQATHIDTRPGPTPWPLRFLVVQEHSRKGGGPFRPRLAAAQRRLLSRRPYIPSHLLVLLKTIVRVLGVSCALASILRSAACDSSTHAHSARQLYPPLS